VLVEGWTRHLFLFSYDGASTGADRRLSSLIAIRRGRAEVRALAHKPGLAPPYVGREGRPREGQGKAGVDHLLLGRSLKITRREPALIEFDSPGKGREGRFSLQPRKLWGIEGRAVWCESKTLFSNHCLRLLEWSDRKERGRREPKGNRS